MQSDTNIHNEYKISNKQDSGFNVSNCPNLSLKCQINLQAKE